MNQPSEESSRDGTQTVLSRIRNMWQFANLCQWIYIFGGAVKIDESIDIEELEMECLKPNSKVISDIALALTKLASMRQGLTFDSLDDQLRKQYLAKAPDKNPFGDGNNSLTFASLDIFKKIQVLQTLTQWIMDCPEGIRDKMNEKKDIEQTDWRIEPYGWDSHDRVYYVLDDNRVYRFTEPPTMISNLRPKTTKRCQRGYSATRRRRTVPSSEHTVENFTPKRSACVGVENDSGGGTWECVAVTLQEVQQFIEALSNSDDENERILRNRIEKYLIPILEKQEALTRRKQIQRERDLVNLLKLANAKRSSRIADKAEKQKREEADREQRRQKQEAEQAERRETLLQMEADKEREFRAISRHQRLKEREIGRRRHEEELAHLSTDINRTPQTTRISQRQIQADIERKRQALQDIERQEEDWTFDCTCGLFGQKYDGKHSISCERCSIWQHSKCVGISEQEAEQPKFHFVCQPCQLREDEQSRT